MLNWLKELWNLRRNTATLRKAVKALRDEAKERDEKLADINAQLAQLRRLHEQRPKEVRVPKANSWREVQDMMKGEEEIFVGGKDAA